MKYILLWVCLVCLTACESTTYQYVNSCESTQNFSCATDTPKNIAIFFDGTGNTPESNTNVYKLYEMLSKNSEENVPSMYIEGVGTEWYRFISGNLFGNGMKPRLVESYKFILNEYKSTDESLYLFGFSRGAYNARALAGLLYTAGLADTNNLM